MKLIAGAAFDYCWLEGKLTIEEASKIKDLFIQLQVYSNCFIRGKFYPPSFLLGKYNTSLWKLKEADAFLWEGEDKKSGVFRIRFFGKDEHIVLLACEFIQEQTGIVIS